MPGPKTIPTREESSVIVERFLLIPVKERTFDNSTISAATISLSVEDVPSDSEGEPSKTVELEIRVKERASSTLKRKRADVLGHDFASSEEATMAVVWPEMKHLLVKNVEEGYRNWDLDDVFNEVGTNAYKAFQGSLAGLSILENMMKNASATREKEVKALLDLQAKVDQLTLELSKVVAEKEALKVSELALEKKLAKKEAHLLQLAESAGDIGAYYSQERAIEMMEEFRDGHHTCWDVDESKKQLEIDFPGGAPGTDLMAIYTKIITSEVADP